MLPPTTTMSAPTLHFTLPPSSFLEYPPNPEPAVLSPPEVDFSWARPFKIDPEIYNNFLNVEYPITIALIYFAVVTVLNRFNAQRDHKPWAITKTTAFYAFVLIHNVFLAIYSGWTFVGMLNAFRHTWPGLLGENGIVGAVDSMCKINGPRGLGSAATYDPIGNSWGFTDRAMKLLDGDPDSTDVGRLWNEGLAYYGWLFYISKFYELVDTLIVLAKGKNSSVLQTYHHAGAIMCMWAGIRYMSSPIWMFVLINSGLHAMMYMYYALTALGFRVPLTFKKTLTVLQITQFVFGATYAAAHLFIAYSIPVSTPYLFVHNLTSAIPSAVSSVSSAVASATVSANVGGWLKKLALRAAGEEGLAENVHNNQGETFGIDAVHAAEVEKAQEEIRYRTDYHTVNCLDTSGQVFAILLNVIYLAPLTWLFVEFFVSSYLRRTSNNPPPPQDKREAAKGASEDARKNLETELKEAMHEEEENDEIDVPENVKAKMDRGKENLHKAIDKGRENLNKAVDKAGQQAKRSMQDLGQVAKGGASKAKNALDSGKQDVKEGVRHSKDKADEAAENAKEGAENAKEGANETVENGEGKGGDIASSMDKVKNDASNKAGAAADKAKAGKEKVADKANEGAAKAKKGADEVAEKATKGGEDAKKGANNAAEKAHEGAENPARQLQGKNGNGKPDNTDSRDNQSNGQDSSRPKKRNTLDESAYEINPDELKDDEEKEAEAAMQPGSSDATKSGASDDKDEGAYEFNPDDLTNKEEKEAEKKMQPNGA